jgi:hypothetical protein
MMSLNAELALASRAMNAWNDRLPPNHKLDLEAKWNTLVDQVNAARSDGVARIIVIEWRQRVRERCATRLAHAPMSVPLGTRS